SIGIAEQSIMNSNIKRGSYETSKERLRSWGIPLPCRRPLSQEFLRRSAARQSLSFNNEIASGYGSSQ
ncbi:MAG: hypothetical protein K8I29_03920, partial [Alphaproteobacteria bacterium]|nr:hypothetical protein [Candidatus Nitrobium versatile]